MLLSSYKDVTLQCLATHKLLFHCISLPALLVLYLTVMLHSNKVRPTAISNYNNHHNLKATAWELIMSSVLRSYQSLQVFM